MLARGVRCMTRRFCVPRLTATCQTVPLRLHVGVRRSPLKPRRSSLADYSPAVQRLKQKCQLCSVLRLAPRRRLARGGARRSINQSSMPGLKASRAGRNALKPRRKLPFGSDWRRSPRPQSRAIGPLQRGRCRMLRRIWRRASLAKVSQICLEGVRKAVPSANP